jgi:arylsulfatase A-like enzyme
MNRIMCCSLLLLFSLMAASISAAEPTRPNILFFVVDDMSANFSCYGEKLIQTPNVDRLAREGTRFTNAFVTAPVCSACRSALITGMYQTSIGAHHHRSGRGKLKINLPDGVVPLPVLFQKAGYFTCNGDGLMEPGAASKKKRNQALGKTDYNFQWDSKMYDSHDWAERKADQPFFMQVQLSGGKLRGGTDESAKKLQARALSELGSATDPSQVQLPPYYPRDPVMLTDWAAYLDSVRFTDRHVGQVIERLEKEGILDNTLIIFMTDHGISHARGKQFLYNEGTHIPFVVRGPSVAAGAVRDDMVMQIDMAAIALAAAGIPIPASMHGKNVLDGQHNPREAIFAARDRCDETVERLRSVRTSDYLYIRNFYPQRPHLQPNAYKDGKSILVTLRKLHADKKLDGLSESLLFQPTRPNEELYQWKSDQWQIQNLASDTAHSSALVKLRGMLDDWMTESSDRGSESDAMYQSDMDVYIGEKPNDPGKEIIVKNIEQMKRWAKEGK